MGSRFEITLVGGDSTRLEKHIDEVSQEVTRIENLISEWIPDSQISEVNRNAGIQPVKVDREVFELTRRAIGYSEMSEGAFDISIAAMDQLWRYDGSMTEVPTGETIQKSIEKVGYRHIILDSLNSTIFLRNPGMKIGFGSIGKGYAADRGRELMKLRGIEGGIVNASGDLSAWGNPPGKKSWKIGVAHPARPYKVIRKIRLRNGSAATSGSYQKFAEIDGRRYSHIIDPRTGYPATDLTSVTITGPSAEFANALSTSVMVLGVEKGRKLLRQFPDYRYILITAEGKIVRR